MSVEIYYKLQSSKEEEMEYEVGMMEEVEQGIYIKQFILFYGDILQYDIEGEKDSIFMNDWDFACVCIPARNNISSTPRINSF